MNPLALFFRAATRHEAAIAMAVMAVGFVSPVASATDYPTGPVRIIMPFSAGSGGDVLMRLIAEKMQEKWGQPVLIEYKPGASTVIGTDFVAKSKPNGYVLGVGGANIPVNPLFFKKLPYATSDVVGVTQLVDVQMAIAARPDAPYNTLPEFIAYAKARPGQINFGLTGLGATYLGIENLKRAAGFDMTHVNFKGSSEVQTDLVGGRLDVAIDPMQSLLPFVQSGRMKIIATLGDSRAPGFEQYAALGETVRGMNISPYLGLLAPTGTPPDVLAKIHEAASQALAMPDVRARLKSLGMSPVGSNPAQFDARLKHDASKFAKVAAELKIEPQ